MIEIILGFFGILLLAGFSVSVCAGATLIVRGVYDNWGEWIAERRRKQRMDTRLPIATEFES